MSASYRLPSWAKPRAEKTLVIKVPNGADPNGVAVDVAAAMEAAKNRRPSDSSDYDLRLLTHLMRKQLSKIDTKAVGDPMEYVAMMRAGLDPRDAIEELMAGNILLTYGRLAHVSQMAADCDDQSEIMYIYSTAERIANNLRRQLLSLINYRNPAYEATIMPAAQNDQRTQNQEVQEALSLVQKGLTQAPRDKSDTQAMAMLDRPQVACGQEDIVA